MLFSPKNVEKLLTSRKSTFGDANSNQGKFKKSLELHIILLVHGTKN
jgi:hypothetical protein